MRRNCKVIATSEGGKKTAAQDFHFNSKKFPNFWETKGVNIPFKGRLQKDLWKKASELYFKPLATSTKKSLQETKS